MGNNPSKNNSLSSGSSACSNSSGGVAAGLLPSALASDEESSKPPPSRCSSIDIDNQQHYASASSGNNNNQQKEHINNKDNDDDDDEDNINNAINNSIDNNDLMRDNLDFLHHKKLTAKPSDTSYFNMLSHSFEDDPASPPKVSKAINIKGSTTRHYNPEQSPVLPVTGATATKTTTTTTTAASNNSTAIVIQETNTVITSTDLSSVSSDFSNSSLLSATPPTHLDPCEEAGYNDVKGGFNMKVPTAGAVERNLNQYNGISDNNVAAVARIPRGVPKQPQKQQQQQQQQLLRHMEHTNNIQKLYNPKFNKKVINHYEIDIDSIIERLIEIGLSKSYSSKLVIEKNEINYIIQKSKEIFLSQPTLLELSSPIKVVGDLHGQFNDLLRILKLSGFPPNSNYLFLGDYVDRGKQSLETILLLLCFKIKYPNNFFMLRGNHESGNISKIYGFYDECKRRLGSVKIWKNFVDVFNALPIAAIISDKIFCVHGGLSPFMKNLKQINKIKRPTDIPDVGLLSDLLWSDPHAKINDWSPNDRGISFFFSKRNVNEFLAKFKFDLIVRGHMVVEDGYEFFNKKRLVTVFSAPNYCGEFNNWGAVMSIDKNLLCSFELLKPVDLKKKKSKKGSSQ